MVEYVSTLEGIQLRGSQYIFILTKEAKTWTEVQRGLNTSGHYDKIAKEVGRPLRLIRTTAPFSEELAKELLAKQWPRAISDEMTSSKDAFLAIIKENLDEFDPSTCDWRIIWFQYTKNPRERLPLLMEVFRDTVNQQREVFDYLDRAVDQVTGIFDYGLVSSPTRPYVGSSRTGPGRPGIFDNHPEALRRLKDGIEQGEFRTGGHGSITKLADFLQGEFDDLRRYARKSLIDAIRKVLRG